MSTPAANGDDAAATSAAAAVSGRWAMVLVFLVALALRAHFVAATDFEPVIRGDAVDYVSYAYNLADKGVFSSARPGAEAPPPDSFRGPGYPALLAATIKLNHGDLAWIAWVRALQALLGALTAVATVWVARQFLPGPWAMLAGLATATWPHLVTSTGFLLTECLAGFLLMLALAASLRGLRARSRGWLITGGLAWGMAYLVNPVFLFAPLALAPWFWSRLDRRALACFALAFALLPVAWAVRNQAIAGDGHSSRERALVNLVQGSWPSYHAAYMSRDSAEEPRQIMQAIDREQALMVADPGAGLAAIVGRLEQAPLDYARWYFWDKPALLWGWRIRLGAGDIYTFPVARSPFERAGPLQWMKKATKAANYPTYLLALVALVVIGWSSLRRVGRGPEAGAVALVFVYLTGVHMVLQAEPRYAIAYRPLEFLLAAAALRWMALAWEARRAGRP